MQLIFSKKFLTKSKTNTLSIYEINPQKRVIITNSNKYFSSHEFPYMYFVVKSTKKDNGYQYGGLWAGGLSLFCSRTRIKSFEDPVYLLPMEKQRNGAVCTDHNHDGKIFETNKELELFIIDSWWKLEHTFQIKSEKLNIFSPVNLKGQTIKAGLLEVLNLNLDRLEIEFPRLFVKGSKLSSRSFKGQFRKD